MKQLILDFLPQPPPTLDNFLGYHNVELLHTLHNFTTPLTAECCIYLWGPAGSGKSHLLQAVVTNALQSGTRAAYISCQDNSVLEDDLPSKFELIAVDDVELLGHAGQVTLFSIFNQLREQKGKLLISSEHAPAQSGLRQDLATRLGWGLVYQVHGLSDEEKSEAMKAHAHERGFPLSPEVASYLLTHWRRDLPSLLAILDALDRYSLQSKRPITVNLFKELFKHDVQHHV